MMARIEFCADLLLLALALVLLVNVIAIAQ
jgi:hypothetical protein